ncbi:MAG: FtsK/SpoIIIE domain-containing protein [Evtepia sp.]
MVDPEDGGAGAYNGIPHLLIPVVTDPKKAAGALQWAVFGDDEALPACSPRRASRTWQATTRWPRRTRT